MKWPKNKKKKERRKIMNLEPTLKWQKKKREENQQLGTNPEMTRRREKREKKITWDKSWNGQKKEKGNQEPKNPLHTMRTTSWWESLETYRKKRYFCKDKDGQDRAKLLTDDRQRENQETEQGRVASLTSSLGGVGEGRRRRRAARVPWEWGGEGNAGRSILGEAGSGLLPPSPNLVQWAAYSHRLHWRLHLH